jgi:hypothetical protein
MAKKKVVKKEEVIIEDDLLGTPVVKEENKEVNPIHPVGDAVKTFLGYHPIYGTEVWM